MNYYTSTISAPLAEKLKEKGMPIPMPPLYAQEAPNARGIVKAGVGLGCPSYAEVFDWLMERNVRIRFHTYPARINLAWGFVLWDMEGMALYDPNPMPNMMELSCYPTWHEAANAAIEKALTLI